MEPNAVGMLSVSTMEGAEKMCSTLCIFQFEPLNSTTAYERSVEKLPRSPLVNLAISDAPIHSEVNKFAPQFVLPVSAPRWPVTNTTISLSSVTAIVDVSSEVSLVVNDKVPSSRTRNSFAHPLGPTYSIISHAILLLLVVPTRLNVIEVAKLLGFWINAVKSSMFWSPPPVLPLPVKRVFTMRIKASPGEPYNPFRQ